MSFEEISLEECFLRIEKSTHPVIQKIMHSDNKYLFLGFFIGVAIESELLKKIVHDYTKEELLARKWVYEQLPSPYESRFISFLNDENHRPIDKIAPLIGDLEDKINYPKEQTIEENDDAFIKRLKDLKKEFEIVEGFRILTELLLTKHEKEKGGTIRVIYLKKNPKGRRPPQRKIFQAFKKFNSPTPAET